MNRPIMFSMLIAAIITTQAVAEDTFSVGKGHITFGIGEGFVKEKPSNGIVEHEFSTPIAEGDSKAGRMTVMGAGGTVEANIDRWVAQFEMKDGDKPKISKEKIAGQTVHRIDLTGSYRDGRPFGPKTLRPGYRMLAAIVETEDHGNYFLKFYGPKATVTKHEKGFETIVSSLKVK